MEEIHKLKIVVPGRNWVHANGMPNNKQNRTSCQREISIEKEPGNNKTTCLFSLEQKKKAGELLSYTSATVRNNSTAKRYYAGVRCNRFCKTGFALTGNQSLKVGINLLMVFLSIRIRVNWTIHKMLPKETILSYGEKLFCLR